MKLVLLSGGSGTRLWPLSHQQKPKQFLEILERPDGKGQESMINRVVRQVENIGLLDHTYLSTNIQYHKLIEEQLDTKVPLILEPESKDTFPAIALSALYLKDYTEADPDEIICVSPVDLYVDETFFSTLLLAEKILLENNQNLAMIGISPSYPAEKYGYIVAKQEGQTPSTVLNVSHFVEKPPREYAHRLIQQNAFWNSGVFCFRLEFLLDLLRQRNLPLTYDGFLENYPNLHKISFDYEVAEKTADAIVIPYHGTWDDVGTWDKLTEKLNKEVLGRGILSEDSNNSHIINELEIPILGIGLENAIIIASDKGILVSEKKSSTRMKEYHQKVSFFLDNQPDGSSHKLS